MVSITPLAVAVAALREAAAAGVFGGGGAGILNINGDGECKL